MIYNQNRIMPLVYTIKNNKIPDFLKELMKKYDVFGPQKKREEVIFSKVENPVEVLVSYETTISPPKKYFFPPEEILFKIEKEKIVSEKSPKPFLIFGLNLKDLAALVYLDEIMAKDFTDNFYFEKRRKSLLVAISPSPLCLRTVGRCEPFLAYKIPSGGDLILERINPDLYGVVPLSKAGKNLLKLKFFQKKDIKITEIEKEEKLNSASDLEDFLLDAELLARAVEWSWQNFKEIWEELGQQCLGCGICTYCCPLCYCFDLEDKIFSRNKIFRCRRWDACTLPEFSMVAGGFNFHPKLCHRVYNWFFHKFVRSYNEFGRSLCVACGRCQKFCPAGIDLEKILKLIIERYKAVQS